MKALIATVALVVAVHGVCQAQETTGDVRGRLRAADSAAVSGAQIAATSTDLLGSRRTHTASDGVFRLLALPPGMYELRVHAIGYRPLLIRDVPVHLGRTTGLGDVTLEAANIQLEEMTITAPRVSIDPVRTTMGSTLEAADYAALPGNRDYTSLIVILPHINTSYHGDPSNSGGSTGLENMYFIDGVNVTTPLKATGGARLPYNFVRSVEVRAGGYEAQYGRALGAIVNAVTYTGTNEFEANVFGFFTHSALSANPRAAPVVHETASLSYDVGVRVSGPVVRNRLWFSAAYNPRVSHVGREISGLGTFPDDSRADNFAGKLTWRATPSTNLELSVFGDPSTHHQVTTIDYLPSSITPLNPDPYLLLLQNGGISTSLRATTSLGSSLLLEASFGRSASRENRLAQTDRGRTEMAVLDWVGNTISGGVLDSSTAEQARTAAVLRGTLTIGRHSAVLGLEYEDGRARTSSDGASLNQLAVDSFRVDSTGFVPGTVHNRVPTVYIQDTWRLTNRLTVNAGVRWSRQYFQGPGGLRGQEFRNEWQPRFGFSWQLGTHGTQRILGSYGRFYQQEPLNLAASFYLDFYGFSKFYSTDPRQPGATPDAIQDYSTPGSMFAYSVPEASAERFDELTLGYERLLGAGSKLTLRLVHRQLGTTFQWGHDETRPPYEFLGTPGTGDLAFLPPARRTYNAFEAAVEGSWRRLAFRASYVLSQTRGNFTGLFGSDIYVASPGYNYGLQRRHQVPNSTGLLPNDRPHVLKLSGTYPLGQSLTSGLILAWMSGTPLNEFGAFYGGTWLPAFLVPRGSVGRTPAILDASVRLRWQSPWPRDGRMTSTLDVLQVGNLRSSVRIDQQHYLQVDTLGNQDPASANPNYLRPTAYQPPMSARLGVSITF